MASKRPIKKQLPTAPKPNGESWPAPPAPAKKSHWIACLNELKLNGFKEIPSSLVNAWVLRLGIYQFIAVYDVASKKVKISWSKRRDVPDSAPNSEGDWFDNWVGQEEIDHGDIIPDHITEAASYHLEDLYGFDVMDHWLPVVPLPSPCPSESATPAGSTVFINVPLGVKVEIWGIDWSKAADATPAVDPLFPDNWVECEDFSEKHVHTLIASRWSKEKSDWVTTSQQPAHPRAALYKAAFAAAAATYYAPTEEDTEWEEEEEVESDA